MKSEDDMHGESNSSDPQKQDRAGMTTRIRKIREAAKGAKLSADQQLTVAENMWRILEDAAQRGILKSRVLHAGGAGNAGDSTKRLERYAVNPALDPATKQVRKDKLTKGAAKYLRLAEAAGRLVEQDPDAYVVSLFNGTDFAAAGNAAATDDIYGELADLLRTVCSGVARKHALQRIAKLCDERYLCYYERILRQNRDDRWSDLWRRFADGTTVRGLLDNNEKWAMPYPSVLIGWSETVQDLNFQVSRRKVFKSRDKGPSDTTTTADHMLKGSLKLEVRLALLPLGPGGTMEPAFITSPWVTIPFGFQQMVMDAGPDGYVTGEEYLAYHSEFEGVRHNYARRGIHREFIHHGWICRLIFDSDILKDIYTKFSDTDPDLSYSDKFRSDLAVQVNLVSPASCRQLLEFERGLSPVTGHEATTVIDDLDPDLGEMDEREREVARFPATAFRSR